MSEAASDSLNRTGLIRRALFVLAAFAIWRLGAWVGKQEGGVLAHSHFDQHTREALAWISGHANLPDSPSWLEIAKYNGQYFSSFPTAPTFLEFPLAYLFGLNTPNRLLLFVVCAIAALAIRRLFRSMGLGRLKAEVYALGWIFATNAYWSLVHAGVWHEGQLFAFAATVVGLAALVRSPRYSGWAYLALAFATGCRPFHAFYFPLFIVLDRRRGRRWSWIARDLILGAGPLLAFYLAYNQMRFGNPLEFGHRYLPWSESLKDGIFSVSYLARNLEHAFLKLPAINPEGWSAWPPLIFDGRGTAFWLNNAFFGLGIALLALSSRVPAQIRAVGMLTLAAVSIPLLLHESNGWYQFGYRFAIDLFPLGVLGMAMSGALRRWPTPRLALLLAISFAINLYGIAWHFRK